MAKVLLDVVLANGTNKQEFVDSFNAETEMTGGTCWEVCQLFLS